MFKKFPKIITEIKPHSSKGLFLMRLRFETRKTDGKIVFSGKRKTKNRCIKKKISSKKATVGGERGGASGIFLLRRSKMFSGKTLFASRGVG